jgi:hypothetical protein
MFDGFVNPTHFTGGASRSMLGNDMSYKQDYSSHGRESNVAVFIGIHSRLLSSARQFIWTP